MNPIPSIITGISLLTASASAGQTVPRQEPDGGMTAQPASMEEGKENRFVALKTNLLHDVLAVPSLGFEISLGSNVSVTADWSYAWWSKASSGRFWRIYGGDLEPRWWLSPDSWTGHHFGVYGQMMTYDFEFGGKGVLAPKWSWAAGISYGYSFPLNRNLNLDLNLGIGWMGGKYKSYDFKCGEFVWKADHRHHYFGPTRLEVSLVWLLDRKNSVNPKPSEP